MNPDLRGFRVFDLVPFGRRRDQFAIVVASGDVCDQGCGQGRGLGDLPAALGDGAAVGQLAQDALQLGAVGVPQAELARDLLGPDLSGIRANEGDDGVPAWKAAVAWFHPRALPALCLAVAVAVALAADAGFAAEVLAADATGARALLVDSGLGL